LRRDINRQIAHAERMAIEREKLRKGVDVEEIPEIDEED
jgi:hypothetical protein